MKVSLIELNVLPFSKECEAEFDGQSRLFGTCYLQEKWLEDDVFSPFEFYFACFNLSLFAENSQDYPENMPKNGYLYLFGEAVNFNFKKLKITARYSALEPDAYTEFNEDFFEDEPEAYIIKKRGEEGDCGEATAFEKKDGGILLFKVKKEFFPEDIACELKNGLSVFLPENCDFSQGVCSCKVVAD